MDKPIEILDVFDVAKMLKLDPQTVSRKANGREIPAFRIGNRWRFRLSDIEDWINKKTGVLSSQKDSANALVDKLEKYFRRRKDLSAIFLFGSAAMGAATEKSDIDIAVLLKNVLPSSYTVIRERIISDLMEILATNKVDVVILNSASPLICYEVVRDGKLICADKKFDHYDYKVAAISEYQDTEYLRNVRYDYFLETVNS